MRMRAAPKGAFRENQRLVAVDRRPESRVNSDCLDITGDMRRRRHLMHPRWAVLGALALRTVARSL